MKKKIKSLKQVQNLLHNYITFNPDLYSKKSYLNRKAQNIISEKVIKKSHTGLLPEERLNIYRDMYIARLIEVLEIDYVLTKQILGNKFHNLMIEYIARYPSKSNTLNFYGKNLPKFFKNRNTKNSQLLFEITTLEWQVSSMLFNCEESICFKSEDFAKLEMSNQQQLKFIKNDTLKLFKFKYPVNKLLTQFYNDDKISKIIKPKESFAALIADNENVWRFNLTKDEYQILKLLFKGNTLEEALEKWASKNSKENIELASGYFKDWFAKWIDEGFFKLIYS